MRKGPVVFWAVTAAVLGVLVALFGRGGGREGAAATATLRLPLEAAEVRVVGSERAGGGVVVVQRVDEGWPTGWAVRTVDMGGEAAWWPADEQRVRAGLRLLTTAELPRREGGAIEGATRAVSLGLGDRGTVDLTLGDRPLGGRIPTEFAGAGGREAVWMDSRLGEALRGEALLLWRDDRVLAVSGAATGFSVRGGASGVELRREGGVWMIAGEPALPVDRQAVADTLAVLTGLKASRVLDPDLALEAERGLDVEQAVLSVESPGGRRRLALGRAADAAGSEVFARATGQLGGQRLAELDVRVPTRPLAGVSASAVDYTARSPVDGGRFDIARVEIAGVGGAVRMDAVRAPDGWSGTEEDARIEALLGVLMREPGAVSLEPEGEPVGTVRLHAAAGRGSVSLTLLRSGDGVGVMLEGERLRVGWSWDAPEAQATLEWAAKAAG